MKSTTTIIVALLLFNLSLSGQTRYRVNNTGVTTDETRLDDAIANASSVVADILIVEHSDDRYEPFTVDVNKEIIIYGTGYFLEDNACTQADTRISELGTVRVTADDVILSGLTIDSLIIDADNVVVERCLIREHMQVGSSTGIVDAPVIRQCYFYSAADRVVGIDGATNLIFANNFVRSTNATGTYNLEMSTTSSGVILNNLFYGEPDCLFKNVSINNNYFEFSIIDPASSGITVSNNYAYDDSFIYLYQAMGTQYDYPEDSIFRTGFEPSRDGRYQLKDTGSNPLENNGSDGTDVGMYGGSYNYVLSGMPPIPSIWFYNGGITGTNGTGVNVNLKAKSRR